MSHNKRSRVSHSISNPDVRHKSEASRCMHTCPGMVVNCSDLNFFSCRRNTCVYMYVCMHACICDTYVYICIFMYIYIYTNTYSHINISHHTANFLILSQDALVLREACSSLQTQGSLRYWLFAFALRQRQYSHIAHTYSTNMHARTHEPCMDRQTDRQKFT
jgi:hypothetical protein